MSSIKSRLISLPSSLKSTYALVSMPEKAWKLLDRLVTEHFPWAGYAGLVKTEGADGSTEALTKGFRRKAQESYEREMAAHYHLANDNMPQEGYGDLKRNPSLPEAPEFILDMPSVVRLFHFMPHATYLTTVYERRRVG